MEGIAAILRALPPRLESVLANIVARINSAMRDVADEVQGRMDHPGEKVRALSSSSGDTIGSGQEVLPRDSCYGRAEDSEEGSSGAGG